MDHAFSDSGCRDRDLLDLEVQQEAPRRPQGQLRIDFNSFSSSDEILQKELEAKQNGEQSPSLSWPAAIDTINLDPLSTIRTIDIHNQSKINPILRSIGLFLWDIVQKRNCEINLAIKNLNELFQEYFFLLSEYRNNQLQSA